VAVRTLAVVAALSLAACTQAHRGAPPAPSHADGPATADAVGPSAPNAPNGSNAPDASAAGDVERGPFFVADPTRRVVPILRADAPSYRYGRLERDA